MNDPTTYRQLAEECLRLAEVAPEEDRRMLPLGLNWLKKLKASTRRIRSYDDPAAAGRYRVSYTCCNPADSFAFNSRFGLDQATASALNRHPPCAGNRKAFKCEKAPSWKEVAWDLPFSHSRATLF